MDVHPILKGIEDAYSECHRRLHNYKQWDEEHWEIIEEAFVEAGQKIAALTGQLVPPGDGAADQMREALEWYADEDNYRWHGGVAVSNDYGQRARAALAAATARPEAQAAGDRTVVGVDMAELGADWTFTAWRCPDGHLNCCGHHDQEGRPVHEEGACPREAP